MRAVSRAPTSSAPWWGGVASVMAGLGWILAGHLSVGAVVLGVGASILVLRALGRAQAAGGRRAVPAALLATAQVVYFAAAAFAFDAFALSLAAPWRVAALATSVQLVLAALAVAERTERRDVARLVFPALGHVNVLWASAVVLQEGGISTHPVLAYAAGFTLLTLHAQWSQRAGASGAEREAGWDPVILGLLAVGLAAAVGAYTGARSGIAPVWIAAMQAVVAAAGLGLLSFLAVPPRSPLRPRAGAGGLAMLAGHGASALALVNAFFLLIAVVSAPSARLTLVLLTLYVGATVAVEYAAVRHRLRNRPAAREAGEQSLAGVTVVVAARDEENVLVESVEHNLRELPGVPFILVPSLASTDDTVGVARRIALAHADRVSVVPGEGGSKALDLNAGLGRVGTDVVFFLDADETVTASALRTGLAALSAPSVGIVQGRKVSRTPDDGWLGRFVAAERRHSTAIDQTMHAQRLGSGHFAGSAALVRKVVLDELDGFRGDVLTEDIDLTLRVHLDTRWTIAYEPAMIVHEGDPADFRQLVRQRTRWARGWLECFARYFRRVIADRRRLGARRVFGLGLILFSAVSAPLVSLLPAALVLRLTGPAALLPWYVALPIALLVIPARLVGYVVAAVVDPVIPLRRTPGRFAELAMHAYLWVPFGWVVQFHAAHLAVSAAPREWSITGKKHRSRRVTGPAPPEDLAQVDPGDRGAAVPSPAVAADATVLAPASVGSVAPSEPGAAPYDRAPVEAPIHALWAAGLVDVLSDPDIHAGPVEASCASRVALKVAALWEEEPQPMLHVAARARALRRALGIEDLVAEPSALSAALRRSDGSPLLHLVAPRSRAPPPRVPPPGARDVAAPDASRDHDG